jgi:hypothetical protein
MHSYNGFTGSERTAADKWLRAEVAAGRRTWPASCEACSQTGGLIDAHQEDYSKPYEKNRIFGLCARCHMMVHLRFRFPRQWARYVELIADGGMLPLLRTRNFPALSGELARDHFPPGARQAAGFTPTSLLIDIAAGIYRPRSFR